jgi:hypothetical protein
MKNLNETTYTNKNIIAWTDYSGERTRIIDIPFIDLMRKTKHIDAGVEATEGEVKEVCVGWWLDGEDLMIDQIYNNDTGEVYFEDHTENWTDEDETLIDGIIMWADVESHLMNTVYGQVGGY